MTKNSLFTLIFLVAVSGCANPQQANQDSSANGSKGRCNSSVASKQIDLNALYAQGRALFFKENTDNPEQWLDEMIAANAITTPIRAVLSQMFARIRAKATYAPIDISLGNQIIRWNTSNETLTPQEAFYIVFLFHGGGQGYSPANFVENAEGTIVSATHEFHVLSKEILQSVATNRANTLKNKDGFTRIGTDMDGRELVFLRNFTKDETLRYALAEGVVQDRETTVLEVENPSERELVDYVHQFDSKSVPEKGWYVYIGAAGETLYGPNRGVGFRTHLHPPIYVYENGQTVARTIITPSLAIQTALTFTGVEAVIDKEGDAAAVYRNRHSEMHILYALDAQLNPAVATYTFPWGSEALTRFWAGTVTTRFANLPSMP